MSVKAPQKAPPLHPPKPLEIGNEKLAGLLPAASLQAIANEQRLDLDALAAIPPANIVIVVIAEQPLPACTEQAIGKPRVVLIREEMFRSNEGSLGRSVGCPLDFARKKAGPQD